jgi:hypothetical protein
MPIGGSPGSGLATMKIYDNKVYGEYAPMLDCPSDGSFCYSRDKYGMGIAGFIADGRSGIPTMHVKYPYDFIMGPASTDQRMIMERNQFFNFDQQTVRGNNQRILYLNTFEGDYFPVQEWIDTQFTNVAAD